MNMETKALIIAEFNANRAANINEIRTGYVGGELTVDQFVKAVMTHLVSEKTLKNYAYNLLKYEAPKAFAETLEMAIYEVVEQSHPAYIAKLSGDEKRETVAYKRAAYYAGQSCSKY